MSYLVIIVSALISVCCAIPLSSNDEAAGRIIGGSDTLPFEYPFQCSIHRTRNNVSSHFCGSTILNERWLLTAAHCIHSKITVNDTYDVRCGKWDIRIVESGEQIRQVTNVVIHQTWLENIDPFQGPFDIALIYIDEPLIYSETVQPTKLPTINFDPYIINNGTIIGWGIENFETINNVSTPVRPDRLQSVQVPFILTELCQNVTGFIDDWDIPYFENFICTGPLTGGFGACGGDSGGAMIQYTGNSTIQIGIAIWARQPCGSINAPSGYLRIDLFLDWIQQNLKLTF